MKTRPLLACRNGLKNAAISVGLPGVVVPEESKLRPKVRHRHLLTLTIMLICALTVAVITEQGRTIDSQRALIQELFQDSLELNTLKQKQVEKDPTPAEEPLAKPDKTIPRRPDGCIEPSPVGKCA